MTTVLSLSLSSSAITAPIGKNGKVSTTNAKAENLLRGASPRAVLAAAMGSAGAVGKLARDAIRSQVLTLDQLLQGDTIEGSAWGDLLTLLVGEFGTAQFSRAQHSGKNGARAYMAGVVAALEATVSRAETVKSQTRAIEALHAAQVASDQVARLINAAEQARIAAQQNEPLTTQ